jgi:hypothetical protein
MYNDQPKKLGFEEELAGYYHIGRVRRPIRIMA